MGLWVLLYGGDSSSVSSLKLMQALQTLGTFCVPCLCLAWLTSEHACDYLRLSSTADWKQYLLIVVFMIVALPGINLLSWLNQQMSLPAFLSGLEEVMRDYELRAEALIERFMDVSSIGGMLINVLVIALLPALSEELLFRGTLQQLFYEKMNKHAAIWVSAIIFSAIHFQFYGFIPRMLMGVFFGYLLLWSGTLWLPITAHFINNVSVVLLYYIFKQHAWDTEVLDHFGSGSTLWMGIVSLLLIVVGIYLCRRSLTMSNASSRMS